MCKLILSIFFLFTVCCAQSQTIQVQGTLIDSLSKAPLPYSSVIIKNQKDSMIGGVLANDKGEFKTNIKNTGNLKLISSSIGYKEKIINIPSDKSLKNFKIGTIALSSKSILLKEAGVESTQKYIEQKFDRKVYNMNESKTTAARTILDLLRTMPGVMVDDEGNVRYKGSGANIFVDDQPYYFLYPQLEMIPVANVEKIELIDASMQTGGSGKGGIINIKFKKATTEGISGLVSSNEGTINSDNLDKSNNFLNLNYKLSKLTFVNNLSYDNRLGTSTTETERLLNSFQPQTVQAIKKSSNYNSHSIYDYFGIVYKPSDKTRFYVGFGYYKFSYTSNSNEVFTEKKQMNGAILNNYNFLSNGNSSQIYNGFNLSFKHNFDTNDTYLRIYSQCQLNNNSFKIQNTYNYQKMNSIGMDSLYKFAEETPMNLVKASVDLFYNHPISKNTRWDLSYNNTLNINDENKVNFFAEDILVLPFSKLDYSNTQEHNFSWRIGTTIKKFKLDGGITLSYNFIKGYYQRYNQNSSDTIINIQKEFFRLLPSATFTYAINDIQELKLTFSNTSNTPYFFQMCNFIDKSTPYSWNSGNSALKPIDFYSVYLGYSYSKEKWNASAEGFYNYTSNDITNVSFPLNSMLVITEPYNLAVKSSIGIDLSSWVMISPKLNMSLSSSIFHTYINSSEIASIAGSLNLSADNLIQRQYGYSIKYNIEYKIKEFYTMFYINYYSKELTFNGYNKQWINSSFNVNRKFFSKKLVIGLGVVNIFNDLVDHGSYSDMFGVSSQSKLFGSKYQRLYTITIKYNFRQGDRGTKDLKV